MNHWPKFVLVALLFSQIDRFIYAAEPAPLFRIRNTHPRAKDHQDVIRIMTVGETTSLDLVDVSGISSLEVTRTQATWPKQLVVKIQLSGLEDFRFEQGATKLKASVLSHSGNKQLLTIQTAAEPKETSVDVKSPYWTTIERLSATGKPLQGLPDPKQGDYFLVPLPAALLSNEADKFEISWINFYR